MLICRFFPKVRVGTCYLSQGIPTLGPSRSPYAVLTQWPLLWDLRGHTRSHSFLPLTFDAIKIERWGCSQCVSLAETHRLICNMTYLARHVTSRHLDLRSTPEIDLLRSKSTSFDAFWLEEHDPAKSMSLAFLVQKLLVKTFLQKSAILTFIGLCSLTRWS